MFTRWLFFLAFAAGSLMAQSDWNEPFAPHRIADGLYYVGSKGLSTYLITTGKGHILINPSFEKTVPIIQANVEKLGFHLSDVKILLVSHAHDDHVGGLARMKELTRAEVYIMNGDDRVIEQGGVGQYLYKARWAPVKVNRVLRDGEQVTLGETTLTAHLTPGHTRGCTTWTMKAKDKGRPYNVVIVGSPNANPGYQLAHNAEYAEIAGDFSRCFRVLKALPCDIFLGAHGSYYDMAGKVKKIDSGTNPFIDPEGYKRYVEERENSFRQTLAQQRASGKQPNN